MERGEGCCKGEAVRYSIEILKQKILKEKAL